MTYDPDWDERDPKASRGERLTPKPLAEQQLRELRRTLDGERKSA